MSMEIDSSQPGIQLNNEDYDILCMACTPKSTATMVGVDIITKQPIIIYMKGNRDERNPECTRYYIRAY